MKSNQIYKVFVSELEKLERSGNLKRNAHHLAQRLTSRIEFEMLPFEIQNLFVLLLDGVPQTISQIVIKTDAVYTEVEVRIDYILNNTTLLVKLDDKYTVANKNHFDHIKL